MNTITIPSFLEGFQNTNTTIGTTVDDRSICLINGTITSTGPCFCQKCGGRMHSHDVYDVSLRHIPFGGSLSAVRFQKRRYECPVCGAKSLQDVPFQAEGHRITSQLRTYCRDLLSLGLTNKMVSTLTGLGRNVVKEIDKERLQELYCRQDGSWKVPDEKPSAIGIDEFKLHDGHKYATIVISMETGHVLYIAKGKRKQVVHDFIDFVGEEWMENVEAVCCDMNSDYQDAFEERCTHVQCVFDYFHIKKNLNDKVISEVRKDEQKRLLSEGKKDEAASLKRARFILTSSRDTLEKGRPEKLDKYERLVSENKLLFTADIVKEKLTYAYSLGDECRMADEIIDIIDICRETRNTHFRWFANLLENHFEGIIAHATYQLSSSKVEGTNNLIKTVRRQAYGYPDDDYFFLKVFDASRRTYVRNPQSPKIRD